MARKRNRAGSTEQVVSLNLGDISVLERIEHFQRFRCLCVESSGLFRCFGEIERKLKDKHWVVNDINRKRIVLRIALVFKQNPDFKTL